MKKHQKLVVGRSEYIDLPDWGIYRILAKVDSGARSSCLHVEDIEELPDGRIMFHVITAQKPEEKRVEVVTEVVKVAKVRSSSGHSSHRYFVKTRAIIGPIEKDIEISVDSRDRMNYRMLLGRTTLVKDFLVDVSKQHAISLPTPRVKR